MSRKTKKLEPARLTVEQVETVRSRNPLVETANRYTTMQPDGHEWLGKCPLHKERTPSFRVYADEHYTCFGCGSTGDVFDLTMAMHRVGFFEAYEMLGGTRELTPTVDLAEREPPPDIYAGYKVVMPVPDDVPAIEPGKRTPKILNPKRIDEEDKRETSFSPRMVHPYRDAEGRLLGYVLRVHFQDGHKITPMVTWCQTPFGDERWCLVPFPEPRPLYGLDRLAKKKAEAREKGTSVVVVIPEGEKAADAAHQLLVNNAVVSWPGGTKSIEKVDWTPLAGDHVAGWPDNDTGGIDVWVGSVDMPESEDLNE